MDYRIFNVRTDVNACGCTRGCADTARESALKVDSGRKIPCRTGESNLRRRRAGPMLYRLSYIPTLLTSSSPSLSIFSSQQRRGVFEPQLEHAAGRRRGGRVQQPAAEQDGAGTQPGLERPGLSGLSCHQRSSQGQSCPVGFMPHTFGSSLCPCPCLSVSLSLFSVCLSVCLSVSVFRTSKYSCLSVRFYPFEPLNSLDKQQLWRLQYDSMV